MTGLERNGDVVFANVDAWQWTPDAIWFDNLRSYGTPNYYVQNVFANNTGTRIVPVTPHADNGLYTSAVLDERTHELILKAVNFAPNARNVGLDLKGAHAVGPAKVITLASPDLRAENGFDQPTHIAPVSSTLDVKPGALSVSVPAYSLTV